MKDEFSPKVGRISSEVYRDTAADYVDPTPSWEAKKKRKKKKGTTHKDLEIFLEDSGTHPDSSHFCSRSEAICAELLRRFVPHFELQHGATFQVPVGTDTQGNTLQVDFLVDGVLFEYHPVRFYKSRRRCGDFKDKDEYKTYNKVFHALPAEKRDFFHSVMRERLAANYSKRRRAVLDRNPLFRRTELIVATTPEEFYHRVITRFGRNYPRSVEKFIDLFAELQHSLPE